MEQCGGCSLDEFKSHVGDLCCRRPPKTDEFGIGWVFCRAELCENDINSSSFVIKEKMKLFMREIASGFFWRNMDSMVQFWAPKMVGDRCYLATSGHPYAVGFFNKGIAEFRKQCAKHHYFVDDKAKQEELGPPGRVFRNSHPETSPDLSHYDIQEFPLGDVAQKCGLVKYLALPVFDVNQYDECIGVLELLNFTDSAIPFIAEAFEAAKLRSAHINLTPRFPLSHVPSNIDEYLGLALAEVKETFELLVEYDELEFAEVWIPHKECPSIDTNHNCMELVLSTRSRREFHWRMSDIHHVQTRKGIFGMLMASKNKSCFCLGLSEFSITEQPRAHFDQQKGLEACFAICLQSSYTGDLLYVAQFFLSVGHREDMPLRLGYFLNFLLPKMKLKLASFKVASGKELGEELVVEVIKIYEPDVISFSELEQPLSVVPIKYKTVCYGRHAEDKRVQSEEQLTARADGVGTLITVKAKYEGFYLTLDLCLDAGMDKLVEQVSTRLDLDKGSFCLTYLDDQNGVILLASDADLEACVMEKIMAAGNNTIRLFVHSIPKSTMP